MSLDLQYSRWTAALKHAGCPACQIMKGEARRYITTLVREGKSHDEVYTRIQRAWGFCERHAQMLKEIGPAKLGDGMSPARLCAWLLGALSMRLSKAGQAIPTSFSSGSGTGAYTALRQPERIPSETRLPLYSRADVRRRSNKLPPGHRVLCRGTISENTGDL